MSFPVKIIAAAAVSLWASAAYAADVPTLDVSRTCRPIAGDRSMAIDTDRCLKTERAAREQLVREWTNFPAADRRQCIQTATMGGLPSYVELITCLEMERDASKLQDRSMTMRPAALPRK